MTNITHYLLQVAVEAPARQTVTVRLEDLNLPAQVIESLAEVNSTPVRAPLSRKLQTELNGLRLRQRAIYDECTIQSCGQHFLVSSYFDHYQDLKRDLVSEVQAANLRLEAEWENEYKAWSGFIDELLRPCLGTSPYFDDACQAYRSFFPTRKEFKNLIRVNIMGPLLVDLTPVAKPVDSNLSDRMAYENMTNTSAMLAQAKGIAEDKAASVCATLLDELDVRDQNPRSSIGRIQTGTNGKRGSWELAANQLKLIAANVPGYERASQLAEDLLAAGLGLQSRDRDSAQKSFEQFNLTNKLIREEFELIRDRLCENGRSGAEVLNASLSMTSEYRRILSSIENAPDVDSLHEARAALTSEKAVMTQRIKKMEQMIAKREEYIHASVQGIDDVVKEVKELPAEADF